MSSRPISLKSSFFESPRISRTRLRAQNDEEILHCLTRSKKSITAKTRSHFHDDGLVYPNGRPPPLRRWKILAKQRFLCISDCASPFMSHNNAFAFLKSVLAAIHIHAYFSNTWSRFLSRVCQKEEDDHSPKKSPPSSEKREKSD